MCILCVIQKWSRRIATMLPWLVIPLIGLWALSQLLPPAFRFEITSPRLACVFVLLVTLFWYEILMPQLSAWRARRNARLRERKRLDAIEMHKLRKTATRRCRNCLTPYREQNPGGGRFMCSYCGHISKRPVLDLPIPPGISDSGILKDFLCKGGKILNRKVWSDNGLICGQDWMENSNWVGGSFMSNPNYWQKTGSSGIFRSEGHCLTEKSYSRIVIFACELMTSFLLSLRWLWGKVFRVSSSMATTSSGVKHSGILAKRTDNGAHLHESRGEKARRKAEEKRQARLEKEILEEEEKKQREEVARLVEERRRLRDEKMEAEKDRSKGPLSYREKDNKKEAEKKCQERRREKDKASSKSNSDAEELEKRTGKESDQKRDCEKRSDVNRREHKKYETENGKFHGTELFSKGVIANNHSRVNTGAKYLDRMRGTLLSSSKAFSRGSFFGKVSSSPASISKEIRSNGSLDHFHTTAGRKDLGKPELIAGKLNMMGADRHIIRPAISESQSVTTPKKSWQQLFTCSSSIPPSANSNVISRPSVKLQAEVMSSQLPAQTFDNPINFGLPSPFTLSSLSTGSTICTSESASATELMFPRTGEATPPDLVPEEPELFEDPCYVPDPVSLLGPVSESLHNFQLDLGTMCGTDMRLEKPLALKNLSTCSEVSKPSPIVSPLSRSRVVDNNHASSGRCTSTPKEKVGFSSPKDDTSNAKDEGTWQMWNSSPLGPDGLGLVVSPVSWILPPEQNRLRQEDTMNTSSHKTTTSLFTNEDPVFSGPYSPQKMFPACVKNGGTFNTHVSGSSDHDPWLQALFPPLTCSGNHFGLRPQEEAAVQNEMNDGSPSRSASSHTFEVPAVNCWSKKERSVRGSVEGKASSVAKPHIGGLYSASDVQSLWSVDWENRK